MNTYNVTEIAPDALFKKDMMLDDKFLLTVPQVPFTDKLRRALLEWEFKQVISEDESAVKVESDAPKPRPAVPKLSGEITDATDMFLSDEKPAAVAKVVAKAEGNTVVDRAIRKVEADKKAAVSIDQNQMDLVAAVYDEFVDYIDEVFTKFSTHRELDQAAIAEEAKALCVFIRDYRRFILRLRPAQLKDGRNFLLHHAVRSTILAVAIALQFNMPIAKQVELASSCLLHEIGMTKIPPNVYITNKPLSGGDRNYLFTHPIYSYDILKKYDFPLAVQLGALEHHEKENGTGYPRHVPGVKISMNAKIISVACAFEAITAVRFHKPARSSYEAMLEMIKNNGQQFNENIVKALLFAVSLYPIGSYVFLQDGKVAQVVDTNPTNPKMPVVQLVGQKDAQGEPLTLQISESVKIMRTLSLQEVADMKDSLA